MKKAKKKELRKNQREALEKWKKHLEKWAEKIKKRNEEAEKLRKRGGGLFKTMKIRCSDAKGKMEEDIVLYAIIHLASADDARKFFLGYIKDIRENPEKYPKQAAKNPREYARADIMLALGLHFTNPNTHKLWEKAISGQRARFSYVMGGESFLY